MIRKPLPPLGYAVVEGIGRIRCERCRKKFRVLRRYKGKNYCDDCAKFVQREDFEAEFKDDAEGLYLPERLYFDSETEVEKQEDAMRNGKSLDLVRMVGSGSGVRMKPDDIEYIRADVVKRMIHSTHQQEKGIT